MGMFTQRPEDDAGAWAALPGEPATPDAADALPVPAVDPFALGISGVAVESIVFPVTPPAPEASDHAEGEPERPE